MPPALPSETKTSRARLWTFTAPSCLGIWNPFGESFLKEKMFWVLFSCFVEKHHTLAWCLYDSHSPSRKLQVTNPRNVFLGTHNIKETNEPLMHSDVPLFAKQKNTPVDSSEIILQNTFSTSRRTGPPTHRKHRRTICNVPEAPGKHGKRSPQPKTCWHTKSSKKHFG